VKCGLLLCLAGIVSQVGQAQDVYAFDGTFVTPGRVVKGTMIVTGDTITCLGRCPVPAGATRIKVDDGFIYPGFIDPHQHMAFNISALWKNTKTYAQRYAWQQDPDYLAFLASHRKYMETGQGWCDAIRYAEIRQLVSGVTTIQGTGRNWPCAKGLIRNADGFHELPLPEDYVLPFIPDIRTFSLNIDWSVTRALAIHLGEGIDEYTRQELDVLEAKGLLRQETLIIHGTAFRTPEFQRMAKAGAKLVWSPASNIALYGKSMEVEEAIRAGVEVSLGVDWSPSGSHDLLAELKVAEAVNREKMHGIIKPTQWAAMITNRPARGLALQQYVGSLAAGMKADFTILRKRARSPHQSLLKNELPDVEMVWVGGQLLYGDQDIVDALKPGVCEPLTVKGVRKRLCAGAGPDSFAQLKARISVSYPGLVEIY